MDESSEDYDIIVKDRFGVSRRNVDWAQMVL